MQHQWKFPYAGTIETGTKQLMKTAVGRLANRYCPEELRDIPVEPSHEVIFEMADTFLSPEKREAEYRKALKAVWVDGFLTALLLNGLKSSQ